MGRSAATKAAIRIRIAPTSVDFIVATPNTHWRREKIRINQTFRIIISYKIAIHSRRLCYDSWIPQSPVKLPTGS